MTTAEVLADLARIKPPPVALAVFVDGVAEPKRVPIPNVRKRWARIASVLDQLPWLAIEARDKADGVLMTWKADGDDLPPAGAGAGLTIREREIADVVLSSFKQAHAMFLGMFGSLLGSIRTQMESMTQTSRHLTTSYEKLLVVQRQTLELQATQAPAAGPADDDDDDGMGQLLGVVKALAEREREPAKDGNPPRPPPKKRPER